MTTSLRKLISSPITKARAADPVALAQVAPVIAVPNIAVLLTMVPNIAVLLIMVRSIMDLRITVLDTVVQRPMHAIITQARARVAAKTELLVWNGSLTRFSVNSAN